VWGSSSGLWSFEFMSDLHRLYVRLRLTFANSLSFGKGVTANYLNIEEKRDLSRKYELRPFTCDSSEPLTRVETRVPICCYSAAKVQTRTEKPELVTRSLLVEVDWRLVCWSRSMWSSTALPSRLEGPVVELCLGWKRCGFLSFSCVRFYFHVFTIPKPK
jgi:hypothetical protein